MKEDRPSIDWQEVYTRLERARQALEAGGQLPPEQAQRILRERAQALARPPEEVSLPTVKLECLVFSLGGERCGIETAYIVDVLRFADLTRVPGTPPFVLGVMNHRGRVLPVLDIQRLLGTAETTATSGSRVLTVEAGGMSFGILADAVAGRIRVGAEELAPPPAGRVGVGASVVRGVTDEMVAILDVDALVRDPRILVNDEVG
jgi:purine-binding chemotaxis protein CheW